MNRCSRSGVPSSSRNDRALAARLAEGAVGRALSLDLDAFVASRQDALIILRTALREPDYSQLFHATESYRAGADGQEKTINLLRALGSLFEDLLLIVAGTPALIRNLDLSASCRASLKVSQSTGSTAPPALWCRSNRACAATCCARSRSTPWPSESQQRAIEGPGTKNCERRTVNCF